MQKNIASSAEHVASATDLFDTQHDAALEQQRFMSRKVSWNRK
jgi:hypothetical protein